MSGSAAERAFDLVNSVGVVAHLDQTSTSYGNETLVEQEMLFLGLHNMRVTGPNTNVSTIQSLAELGIKFDVIANSSNLAADMALLDSAAPYVESVEGPNEVDAVPISYKGLSGVAAAVAFQKDLFSAVKADPLLRNVSVLPFSVADNNTAQATYGDMSAYADYGNLHAYASFGVPPSWWMSQSVKMTTTPERQTVITETGNYTLFDGASGVNQDVQAKWLVDTVLDAFKAGVKQTYLYQLMDMGPDPSGSNPEDHWGLFNPDGTPKLAATALHNLTTILADNNPNAATFTPGSLNYTVSGLPAYSGFNSLLENAAGTFDLQLWQEPLLWNEQTRSEYVVPAANVTVSFADVMYQVQVFDPLVGTAPITTYSYVKSISLPLGTDALIVQVTPTGTVSAIGTPPSPVISGLSYGTDTGASATDGVTANVSPTLVGTAATGALITVYDGAAAIGTAVASSSGLWALAPTKPLANGPHTLTAVASSTSGHSSASAGYVVVVESAAPTIGSITASLASGSTIYPTQAVSIQLKLTEPILINTGSGLPSLTLNTGGTATFNAAASTATSLVFTSTILGGQSAADLKATGLLLNGAAATDLAGNSLVSGSLAATPGSDTGITVSNVPLPVTLGAGPQSIVANLSEYGWQGDAQVVISVDGVQIGGTETVTATHGSQTQAFTLDGNFGQGSHVVAVTFVNNLWQGTLDADRKVYVDSIAGGGVTQAEGGSLLFNGTLSYNSPILWTSSAPVSLGSGPQSMVVNLSENAWHGDAQFTISVDGSQIGGTQTATAEHGAGLSQAYTLNGSFSPGVHVVTVNPLNYTYGGAMPLQRVLNIDSVTAAGATTALNTSLTGYSQSFYVSLPSIAVPPVTLGAGPDSIQVGVSEDAFEGNAQFTISVDGSQIGGIQTANAQHGSGQNQIYTLDGSFGRGSHQVSIQLLNAAWDATHARKLYVNTVAAGGVTQTAGGGLTFSGSTLSYNSPILWTSSAPVSLGSGPQSMVVNLSENAWHGDAQFTISVDGSQIGGTQTATAEHGAGLSQAYTLNGSFSPGVHVVTVNPLNYTYGGAMPLQRVLNIDSVTAAGATTALNTSLTGYSQSFYVSLPSVTATLKAGQQASIGASSHLVTTSTIKTNIGAASPTIAAIKALSSAIFDKGDVTPTTLLDGHTALSHVHLTVGDVIGLIRADCANLGIDFETNAKLAATGTIWNPPPAAASISENGHFGHSAVFLSPDSVFGHQ